jgi:hypothetical protein
MVSCCSTFQLFTFHNFRVKYQNRPELDDKSRQLVKCGNSIPILWQRPEGAILGFLDTSTELGSFAVDGKYFSKEGGQLKVKLAHFSLYTPV